MKSKAPLPLMEQLIMVLVFALTSALCLRGFSLANSISQEQESREHAVIAVQNAAEVLKHTSGDFERAATQLGGYWDGNLCSIPYDSSWQPLSNSEQSVFLLQAIPLDDDNPFLGTAQIKVLYKDKILFEITVGWQEVNGDAVT